MTDRQLPGDDVGTRTDTSPRSGPRATLGPYHLIRLLGSGGMGEVWLAEQMRPLRRQVAIKVIKAGMDTAQVVARFEAERQALAMMDHSVIAKVFDAGTTPEGRPYFAMEYVRGEVITTYCDRHRLSIPDRLELFGSLCDGVQHAHQKGIIHRDLKPSNVLVTVADDRAVPRIIDFGIAKAVSQPLTERPLVTEVGGLLGTPEYMSPEQAEGTALDVDTRSDVYSLGVLLYELMVGAPPFDSATLRGGGIDEIRRTIRDREPLRPSTRIHRDTTTSASVAEHRRTQPARLASVLRGDLDWIILKALEKDRTRRYQTANALALDVRRYLNHEPALASPPSTIHLARKFVRRHRVGVGVFAMCVALLIAVAGITTVQARRTARERDRANNEAMIARQVSDFLVGLFAVSDPSESRGNTLTAQEILASGAARIDDGLRDQPEVQARLQATIGKTYTGLGSYGEARALLERAWQTQRRLLGEDAPETLATAHAVANTHWYLRNYPEAERLYRTIIEQKTRRLGADHQDTLKAKFDLASVYGIQRRWAEFEPIALDALAGQRRALGEDHTDTLASLSNIAGAYSIQGRYTEALPMSLEVVEKKRRLLGDTHPSTLISRFNLADLFEKLGRYDEAETLYRAVADGRRRVLGDHHPSTATAYRALGALYLKQRRFDEADKAFVAAYDVVSDRGAADPNAKRMIEAVRNVYEKAGLHSKAAEWQAKLDAAVPRPSAAK